jgi:hypothetical protein
MAAKNSSKRKLAAVAVYEDAAYLRCKTAQEHLFAVQRDLSLASAIMDIAQAFEEPNGGCNTDDRFSDRSLCDLLVQGRNLLDSAGSEAMALYNRFVLADEAAHPAEAANG